MKIQDIFNLPKNRGGYKLFNRIMNRYGIPKDYAKELKKNIDNSSSGGGSSSDIEYYTLNINNSSESLADVIFIIMQTFSLYKYTYKPINEHIENYITGSANFMNHFNDKGTTNIIAIAFMPIYLVNIYAHTLKDLFIEIGLDITNFDKVFEDAKQNLGDLTSYFETK